MVVVSCRQGVYDFVYGVLLFGYVSPCGARAPLKKSTRAWKRTCSMSCARNLRH